jgi:tRNA1(Val) A37 N6-methylase TrmN6
VSQTTEGTLLGGKIRYRQFTTGHRSGFEPVLLAAAINPKPGDLILEAGTGAGAALLCLAHRNPGLTAIGLEIDADLAALAAENFRINGFNNLSAAVADACQPPFTAVFDHIIANPPWFDRASTTSPDPARARAHHAPSDLLNLWITSLTQCLKPDGSMTLILPASSSDHAAAAFAANHYGGLATTPLIPRAGRPAKQLIISASRAGSTANTHLPGLILHDAAGITPEANAILRDGATMTAAPYPASRGQ